MPPTYPTVLERKAALGGLALLTRYLQNVLGFAGILRAVADEQVVEVDNRLQFACKGSLSIAGIAWKGDCLRYAQQSFQTVHTRHRFSCNQGLAWNQSADHFRSIPFHHFFLFSHH